MDAARDCPARERRRTRPTDAKGRPQVSLRGVAGSCCLTLARQPDGFIGLRSGSRWAILEARETELTYDEKVPTAVNVPSGFGRMSLPYVSTIKCGNTDYASEIVRRPVEALDDAIGL